MNGTANVGSASRPHYGSSIPVPRAASQTRAHTPGTSPQPHPRQAGLALSPQRAASPRPGKASGASRGSSPRASRGRGSPKPAGAVREPAEGADGLCSSPWGSPRAPPKAAPSSRAGPRRAGETQGSKGQKKAAREGLPVRQARGRSPAQTGSCEDAQVPGAPEGPEPPTCPGRDQRERNHTSSGVPGSSGAPSPACSPGQSRRPVLAPGPISFSSVHPQGPPATATVAPFQYR